MTFKGGIIRSSFAQLETPGELFTNAQNWASIEKKSLEERAKLG